METRYTVSVSAEWHSSHTFEFDTEEEAERFIDRVESGGNDSLDALVDAGDVDSGTAELADYSANPVVGTTNG